MPRPRPDGDAYRRRGIRNALWFWWLRRPLPSALRRTVHLLETLPRDATSAQAVLDAARAAPWIIAHRRVVPPDLERRYRLMDGPQMSSRARRHGR